MAVTPFETSVFINCPFDDGYAAFFRAIVFTIMECGFTPRCALEEMDSAQSRMAKILGIIAECRLSVHDISRTDLGANGLPRFNMPLELGIVLGARHFDPSGITPAGRPHPNTVRQCIVFDKDKFRYREFMSDIGGQDIHAHGDHVGSLIRELRNWLAIRAKDRQLPGGAFIASRFSEFMTNLPEICGDHKLAPSELTFKDLVHVIRTWLSAPP